jgi:hypothetical protein
MTQEEQLKLNSRIQQDIMSASFKRESRTEALKYASQLMNKASYVASAENNSDSKNAETLLKEADKIYDWLTKEISGDDSATQFTDQSIVVGQ